MTPHFITWHGHDLPLCEPDLTKPASIWPALPLDHICATLAHIPRFNAAQRQIITASRTSPATCWSVAQHLLLCGTLAKVYASADTTSGDRTPDPIMRELIAASLVHDVHEAFLGDIISPVVWALPQAAQDAVQILKLDVDAQLRWHHKTPISQCMVHGGELAQSVKEIDQLALQIERACFLVWNTSKNANWFGQSGPSADTMHPMLSVAGSSGFQHLRNLHPQDAADNLAAAITDAAAAFAQD